MMCRYCGSVMKLCKRCGQFVCTSCSNVETPENLWLRTKGRNVP